MDTVWLVLDSLGYLHTPFAPDGPDTAPKLARLANEHGVIFNNAYPPGPASPSSHGSFFTGRRPSEVGMNEAYPYFDGSIPTIADRLGTTHSTYLTSVNPFLFNGLDESFDTADDLAAQQFLAFSEATNPRDFGKRTDSEGIQKGIEFLRQGKPLRSFVNGLIFKLWLKRGNAFLPKSVGDTDNVYQYASAINRRIRSCLDTNDDSFIVANYMDAHPPFDVSDDAIQNTASEQSRVDLPIGVRAEDTDDYDEADMLALYHAAIWDLDRQLAPIVEELIEEGAFVVVTADHGPRFKNNRVLTENRLHVPLVIFAPWERNRHVEHTVNLRSLPRTTMAAINRDNNEGTHQFPGEDILSITADQMSVTEHIHTPSDSRSPVNPYGNCGNVAYDLYLREGDSSITLVGGDVTRSAGDNSAVDRLTDIADEILADDPKQVGHQRAQYDEETEQRLHDLGYL